MSIEVGGQSQPVPTFFLPEAFDNATSNNITALDVTVNGLYQLDFLMRQSVRQKLPVGPEELALVMYRTTPGGRPYRHFYELGPDEFLIPANQLGLSQDEPHLTTSKAEALKRHRTILEVQVADFVGGTLSHRVIWAALNEPPEVAHSNPRSGLRQFAVDWGNRTFQAITGPSQERKQKLAEEAARRYPQAVYLHADRGHRLR